MLSTTDGARADADLLQRMAQRDACAFELLYARYAPRILGLLQRMLGRGEADDVLQETFWQAWNSAERFDASRASVATWLVVLARSRARDRLRRRSQLAQCAGEPEDRGTAPGADEAVAQREAVEGARSALRLLSEEQRRVISLAFFGGLTHEEIATRESLPLGTVKTRIRRGLGTLRDLLADQTRAAS